MQRACLPYLGAHVTHERNLPYLPDYEREQEPVVQPTENNSYSPMHIVTRCFGVAYSTRELALRVASNKLGCPSKYLSLLPLRKSLR